MRRVPRRRRPRSQRTEPHRARSRSGGQRRSRPADHPQRRARQHHAGRAATPTTRSARSSATSKSSPRRRRRRRRTCAPNPNARSRHADDERWPRRFTASGGTKTRSRSRSLERGGRLQGYLKSALQNIVRGERAPAAKADPPPGVTYRDILDGLKDPSRWLTFSGDYSGQRHSPLTQINPAQRRRPQARMDVPDRHDDARPRVRSDAAALGQRALRHRARTTSRGRSTRAPAGRSGPIAAICRPISPTARRRR